MRQILVPFRQIDFWRLFSPTARRWQCMSTEEKLVGFASACVWAFHWEQTWTNACNFLAFIFVTVFCGQRHGNASCAQQFLELNNSSVLLGVNEDRFFRPILKRCELGPVFARWNCSLWRSGAEMLGRLSGTLVKWLWQHLSEITQVLEKWLSMMIMISEHINKPQEKQLNYLLCINTLQSKVAMSGSQRLALSQPFSSATIAFLTSNKFRLSSSNAD